MCTCQRNGEFEVISKQTETLNESLKVTVPEMWLQLVETKRDGHSQCSRKEGRKRKGCFEGNLPKHKTKNSGMLYWVPSSR